MRAKNLTVFIHILRSEESWAPYSRNYLNRVTSVFLSKMPSNLHERLASDSSEIGWLDYSVHSGKMMAFILSGYF